MSGVAALEAAYDAVSYPALIVAGLAPEKLHAASLLYGVDSPDPATASFLELGCSDGLNLIAFAAAHPRARCVGIDLSAPAIARGREIAAEAGIANVELIHGDLMEFPRSGEPFDYISAHGVLSWVPEPIAAGVFELIGARLSPAGVAYVSYDVLPGAAGKAAIAAYIRPLVSHIGDIERRVDAFVSVAAVLRASQADNSELTPALDFVLRSAGDLDRNYFYHDCVGEPYRPLTLREVAGHAEAAGLRLFGEVGLHQHSPNVRGAAAELLAAAGDDFVRRSETIGLLRGNRTFRADMLCRSGAPAIPLADAIPRLSFSFDAGRNPDPATGAVRYVIGGQTAIEAFTPELVAVLDDLVAIAPHEAGTAAIGARTGLAPEAVASALFGSGALSLLEVHASPEPFVTTPGERPATTGLNRVLARRSPTVVSLRHRALELPGALPRMLLMLCDGTRTPAAIAAILAANTGQEVTPEQVMANLEVAARLRLLLA